MTKLTNLADLYAATEAVSKPDGVHLAAISDPAGASLDRAVRELGREAQDGGIELLDDLLSAARQLRWLASVEPYPPSYSARHIAVGERLTGLTAQCRVMVGPGTRWIVDELARGAANLSAGATPPVGEYLVQSLRERAGPAVVVTAGRRAADGIRSWLRTVGMAGPVMDVRERSHGQVYECAYLVGPPQAFGPVPFGSPIARNLIYLFPMWIQARTLPVTEFSKLAEGGMTTQPRLHRIGQEVFIPDRLRGSENQLLPESVWKVNRAGPPAGEDEVHARRVFLSGGLSIMLDLEGDSIRALDPGRPTGGRVTALDVEAVAPGAHLVLREGQTESAALYTRALSRLGTQASQVEESQSTWKAALQQRLDALGTAEVVRQLRAKGIKAARRGLAWTAPTLVRPQSDTDFRLLLEWLSLPLEPYNEHANILRRARSSAAAEVREALEAALGDADIAGLEETGILRLDLDIPGFAGIIATRVLAIAPDLDVVPRHELRIPAEDGSARWLE